MKSIISVVNDSLIETEQKQNSLEDSYEYLRHEVQIQKLAQGTIKLETAIIEKITIFNLILTQFAYETNNLANIVNSALQGFIYSSLVDTEMFIEQLREIKLHLSLDLGLPVNLSGSDVSELLRLATVNIVYVRNILTFIIEFPLINNFEFILYKSIPLPVKLNNDVYLVIEPTNRIHSDR